MSVELSVLTPDKKVESPKEIRAGLEQFYESTRLKPMEIFEVQNLGDKKTSINSCERTVDGTKVCQNLVAIVEAGGEFFSVSDILTMSVKDGEPHFEELTAVSRRKPGQRAELVGLLGDNEFLPIGRAIQPDSKFDDRVSRKHFTIGRKNNGKDPVSVGIADFGSSNGTTVYTTPTEGGPIPAADSDNPVNDLELWSIKSAKLKEAIDTFTS